MRENSWTGEARRVKVRLEGEEVETSTMITGDVAGSSIFRRGQRVRSTEG